MPPYLRFRLWIEVEPVLELPQLRGIEIDALGARLHGAEQFLQLRDGLAVQFLRLGDARRPSAATP